MSSSNNDIQRLLNELGHALSKAVATSDEINRAVRRIRNQGFALSLTLDCQQDGTAKARVALPTCTQPEPGDQPPAYRLDGQDVAMLKALGIDATRPARRRRG